jgi:hypothetical protein
VISGPAGFPPRGESRRLPCPAAPNGRDFRILKAQSAGRTFDLKGVVGIARRCLWGAPQVVLCRPVLRGAPFPTSLWLVCPHLDRLCGRREAEGGVKELDALLARVSGDYLRYARAYAAVRLSLLERGEARSLMKCRPRIYRVLRTGGVGGTPIVPGRVHAKCLHLQVAAWLCLGGHPAAAHLAGAIAPLSCSGGLCVAARVSRGSGSGGGSVE